MTEPLASTAAGGPGDTKTGAGPIMGDPGPTGRFGQFGGRFVPESLVPACMELEAAFRSAWADPLFHAELDGHPPSLRWSAHTGHRVRPAVRGAGRPAPAEAGGPGPHRLPQAQQRRSARACWPGGWASAG